MRRLKWRRPAAEELDTWRQRLKDWPCEVGGAVRHMFPLACLDAGGPDVARVATYGDDRWALAIVHPGKVVVPCGHGDMIRRLGAPVRRWRLLVGDAGAAGPLVDGDAAPGGTRVHEQRFFTVDADRVPAEAEVPDPGMRRAELEDVEGLTELAIRLHIDDEFGPDPGRGGRRGYRDRMERAVRSGMVFVVGPVGAPVCKVERSVSSPRWGVQLSGIVVDPTSRGSGIGRGAVATAVRQALAEDARRDRPVSLHVRAANHAAHRTYQAAGFVDREEWRLAVRA